MENEIILKPRELQVRTLDDGRQCIQIKGNTAFDDDFIGECQSKGVKEYIDREEESESE